MTTAHERYRKHDECGYCHSCGNKTETVFLKLSSGHIGNCCAICRTTRKGRPYATHREYKEQQTLMPARAKGDNNEKSYLDR